MVTFICLLLFLVIWLLINVVLSPPRRLTKPNPQIPIVPIWVALLPLLYKWLSLEPLGQNIVFQKYLALRLKQVGVVWIFFGGRWNLLVSDPNVIKQVLTRFEKSGNHIKIPNSVIAQLTGSNVISENGEKWKRYRKVLTVPVSCPVLDLDSFREKLESLFDLIDECKNRDDKGLVVVNPLLQRYSMDTLCQVLFHTDLGFLTKPKPLALDTIHSLVKQHIFDPIFLNFPILDQEPWVKLFPQRRVARTYVDRFEKELLDALNHDHLPQGSVLREMKNAVENGVWTKQEYIDHLKILFIAGHENTQQALNSILYMLAIHQSEQEDMRTAILSQQTEEKPIETVQVRRFVLETLRLLPPIPQLFNRRATEDTPLQLKKSNGETIQVVIPINTYAGWTAYGAHRWNPESHLFQPCRWGNTIKEIESYLRNTKANAEFLSFHWGQRSCIGIKLAMTELQIFTYYLLKRYRIKLPEGLSSTDIRMTPGGLLAPKNLSICFEDLEASPTLKPFNQLA